MLLLIILLQPFIFYHDVALANFEINQKDGNLTLEIRMDKEDLNQLYSKEEDKIIDLSKETNFVQKYLNQHFYLVINNQKIDFTLQQISQDKYFYNIELLSQNKVEEIIRHIQLKNTCLIEQVDNHSNIVNFQINGKYRTFRLHKSRIRIDVKY